MQRLLIALIMAIAVHATQAAEQQTAAMSTADKRPTKIWDRTDPLGETPKHVTDAYPLSDQENKGGWIKFEPMTDEFEGQDLDLNKWNRGHVLVEGSPACPVQRQERHGVGRQVALDDAQGNTC